MKWMILAFSILSAPAFGQQRPGAGPSNAAAKAPVQVQLWTVHATDAHQQMDTRLKRIAKHLANLKFRGFDLLGKQNASLGVQARDTFKIVGKRTVEVTVLSRDEKRVRVRVRVRGPKGKLLDTTVAIRRNGFFMVAGPPHKGGVLVLPIFARY
jgi:hypothetical protein